MNTKSLPTPIIEVEKKTASLLVSTVLSILLLFFLLFPLTFMELILHEGGHALDKLTHSFAIQIFYAHPFSFNGYVRPFSDWNSVWRHASGAVVSILVSLLIFIPFWKHRSVSTLPILLLFPWIAIKAGFGVINIAGETGDYYNIIKLMGMSPTLFYVFGFIFFSLGIFFCISLFPLLGLAPQDRRSLFVIPAAVLMWSVLSIIVAYLFVPGSPIDIQYHLGGEIIMSANSSPIFGVIIGVLLAVIYISLYRGIYRGLPTSLRAEKVILSWRDLWYPCVLFTISMILGLLVIT